MTAFLEQVARHYHASGEIEKLCFIFPNKRATAFFKKHLCQIASETRIPFIAPGMLTMNELFYRLSGKRSTDKVHLLLRLYECYKKLNPVAEPLDDFIFWGDIILSDFDDVDKYLVDAGKIFTNAGQLKEMRDGFDYLSEVQEEAVRRFLRHFEKEGRIKTEFRKIWDILPQLYLDFGAVLDKNGISYEGRVYRQTAERLRDESAADLMGTAFPETRKFIFVGLNALNECEKTLMRKCSKAGIAEFCWDYCSELIKDKRNKSSFFLSSFVSEFGQAFELEKCGKTPEIRVISVPSAVGQAKMLPSLLGEIPAPDIHTAVILPDESALIPVLNSIPENIGKLNVTMGYPMSGSSLWSLMNDIAALQLHIREKDGRTYFYHKQVWAIFSNGLFKASLGETEKDKIRAIRNDARYYVPEEELSGTPLLDAIFRKSGDSTDEIGRYQQEIVLTVTSLIKGNDEMALELDFAKDLYQAIERLKSYELPIQPVTYYRLLRQMLASLAVPFQGEPLEGLQIMGPLETRALDFDNVIILNCNEGIFPRRNVSSSFIPPELRKAFGLPTYEYQDAVWAYYFYRLIQRAGTVTLLYDSRMEGVQSGEESRYIKQLELHFNLPIKRFSAQSAIQRTAVSDDIPKTVEHVETIRKGHLSASSLQNYLSCPAKFYFATVCGLKEEKEVCESLDSSMLGTVFHAVMQELYEGRENVSADYLKELLASPAKVRDSVRRHIMEVLHSFEIAGRNIIFEDMVFRFVLQTLRRDLELLKQRGVPSFKILGLELKCWKKIGGFNFTGVIDRLDCFSPGEVRVVDYKTGKVSDNDFLIDEDNAEKVVGALFGSSNKDRPKIALQLYLYDLFARDLKQVKGKNIVNSIYQTSRLFVKDVEECALNVKFCTLMKEGLENMLLEIEDTGISWSRTSDQDCCKNCEFKNICGR